VREEHRQRLFENRVLRRIFGPVREEVAGGWSRLHNEELRNLCSSSNIIRVILGVNNEVTVSSRYDRVIGVRFPAGAGTPIQTGSGAHPASYPMGAGGSFPGVKATGA
jgi:hypothetical protein